MDATLQGTLVLGFGRTLARALTLVLLGIPIVSVAPVMLQERGYLTEGMLPVVFGTGLAVVLLLLLNEIWMRGALKVTPEGLAARQQRLLQWTPRVDVWPWAALDSYRFDTDPQGRPYVKVTPKGEADLSCYGRASAAGQAQFAAFEAAFRAAVAQANAGVAGEGVAEAASIVEAPSFYTQRWVRVGSVVALTLAVALTLFLLVSGHAQAGKSVWMLFVVAGFAARVWMAGRAA